MCVSKHGVDFDLFNKRLHFFKMAKSAFVVVAVAVLCVAWLGVCCVDAISFKSPVSTRKCLQEDVHKDVLVVGNYDVSPSDLTIVSLDVSGMREGGGGGI